MLDSIFGRHPHILRTQSRAARALLQLGLTPNRATTLGLALGIGAGAAFAHNARGWGITLLALSALLDALDGTIARESATITLLGGILDLCSDRVVEAAVLIGIAWRRPEIYLPALILAGSWYINITVFLATGAAMEKKEKFIPYPPGIVERTEAIIFFVFLALIRPIGPILCYAYTVLELVTGCQRALFAWRNLSRH